VPSVTASVAKYLTLLRAVEYSGLSMSSLRRLETAGLIRFYRPRGRIVLVDKDELDAAIRGEAHISD
jgi:excisionase family DNA binding protein